MAVLQTIGYGVEASGEFVATEGFAVPVEATLVRREKGGMPVTGGVFPESKEFFLGYWIVDVQNTRPARSPVNASTLLLRAAPHDSGPMWVARPLSYGFFIHYTSPV
jgi:hypothetical protein